jgi:ATP-dependent DNA ligase
MLTLEQGLKKLDKLSLREITGNAAIEYLALLLSELRAGDAKVVERVIEKDLRCGVSEKTVNKIWPKLIPEYPVMLCDQYDDKTIERIKFPAFCQLKLDGMRFNAICKNGLVEFRTRNGKQIDIRGYLVEEFIELAAGRSIVFDGELLVYDSEMYQYLPRQTSNGILSKSLKGTIVDEECKRVGATVWDSIPLSNFEDHKCDIAYRVRFESLKNDVERVSNPKIKLVWNEVVSDVNEAIVWFERFLAEGQEGIILKDISSFWESKRVKHQLKFKGELECDLRVVGWEEGTGKNVGRLGALVVESGDGIVRVKVGSGFSDDDRNGIGPEVVGCVVSVKYNARIRDKRTGIDSLFLPIFVEVRYDKDVVNMSKEIK